jgi:hypothetical protein
MKLSDMLGWRFIRNSTAPESRDYIQKAIVGVYINAKGKPYKQSLYLQSPCARCGSDFLVGSYLKGKTCGNKGCPDSRMRFEDIGHLNEGDNLLNFYKGMLLNGESPPPRRRQGPEINEDSMRESFDIGGAMPAPPGTLCQIEIRPSTFGTRYDITVPRSKIDNLDGIIGIGIGELEAGGEFDSASEMRKSYSGFITELSRGGLNDIDFKSCLGSLVEKFLNVQVDENS